MLTSFLLATPGEIAAELGRRLQAARLGQRLQQGDLARMAGVSRGALSALENHGKSNLETFLRVASSLGLTAEMEALFSTQPVSIAQLEAAAKQVRRAPRKRREAPEAVPAPQGPTR